LYEWVEHTAEVELRIEAETPAAVFREAMAAFAELAGDDDEGEAEERELWLVASDRASLLVRWLEDLVYLADAEGFLPIDAPQLDVGGKELRARVRGHVGVPRPLVKAVTYHGLEFRRTAGLWHAKVVFDV
jgi:SHS2 domain-containing protein